MNARELSIISKNIEEARKTANKKVYNASQNKEETVTLDMKEITLIRDCLVDTDRLVTTLLANTEVDNTTLKGFQKEMPF